MDYKDLQPLIDELGVTITIRSKTVTAINDYGEETFTNSDTTVKASVQKYNKETHSIVGQGVEEVPDFVAYLLVEVTGAKTVVYNGQEFKVVNIISQPISSTYFYYRLDLKRML